MPNGVVYIYIFLFHLFISLFFILECFCLLVFLCFNSFYIFYISVFLDEMIPIIHLDAGESLRHPRNDTLRDVIF